MKIRAKHWLSLTKEEKFRFLKLMMDMNHLGRTVYVKLPRTENVYLQIKR